MPLLLDLVCDWRDLPLLQRSDYRQKAKESHLQSDCTGPRGCELSHAVVNSCDLLHQNLANPV